MADANLVISPDKISFEKSSIPPALFHDDLKMIKLFSGQDSDNLKIIDNSSGRGFTLTFNRQRKDFRRFNNNVQEHMVAE